MGERPLREPGDQGVRRLDTASEGASATANTLGNQLSFAWNGARFGRHKAEALAEPVEHIVNGV